MTSAKEKHAFWDGFFYFFGFTENPAKEMSTHIMEQSASEKIKSDLKRINKSYRSKLAELQAEIYG